MLTCDSVILSTNCTNRTGTYDLVLFKLNLVAAPTSELPIFGHSLDLRAGTRLIGQLLPKVNSLRYHRNKSVYVDQKRVL